MKSLLRILMVGVPVGLAFELLPLGWACGMVFLLLLYFTWDLSKNMAMLLMLCVSANATTYFVDVATGNDANAGTSQGSPWAHIPTSAGSSPTIAINNGDTIVVKGGSQCNQNVGITALRYTGAASYDAILIQSGHLLATPWGTGRAIIDGQNTRTYGVGFGGVQGVTLDGFEIRNIAAGNNAWGGNGSAGVELGDGNGFSFVTIKRCYVHDCIRSASDQGHGMEADHGDHLLVYYNQIGPNLGTKGIEPFHVGGGVISNNFITGSGDHCVALTSCTNFDVCNNLIVQAGAQVHEPTYCISVSVANYCDVWNNVMYDSASSLVNTFEASGGIGLYASPPQITYGNRFFYNTLYGLFQKNNGGVSTAWRVGDDSGSIVTNITGMNNIVLGCTNLVGPEQFYVRNTGSTNQTFTFNDFYGTAPGQTVMSHFDGVTTIYETVAGFNPGNGGTYANNQQLDPAILKGALPTGLNASFIPNTDFFTLTASTPTAVTTTGNSVTGDATHGYSHSVNKFNTDIAGHPRSTLFSMGAYEFQPFPPAVNNVNVIFTGKHTASGKVLIQ